MATLRHNAEAIVNVETPLRQMRALKSKKPQNLRLWSDLNLQFHTRLYAASGRPHWCRMISTLRESVETYIRSRAMKASVPPRDNPT